MGKIKNWDEFLKDVPTTVLIAELERRQEEEKNNIKASPIAHDIMEEIDNALVQFGDYTFGDKGPHEVMAIYTFTRKLRNMPAKDIAEILTQVLDNYPLPGSVGSEGHGERTVNAIIGDLDDIADFDDLFQYDDRFEY